MASTSPPWFGMLLSVGLLGFSGCITDPIVQDAIPSDRFADATYYRRGTFEPPEDSDGPTQFLFTVKADHLRVALEWSSEEGRVLGGWRLLRPDGTDVLTESFNKGAKRSEHWYEQDTPVWGNWTLMLWSSAQVRYSVGAYY